jgi:hypothetical protein
MTLLPAVPTTRLHEYMALSRTARSSVERRLAAMLEIDRAPEKVRAMKDAAEHLQGLPGCSFSSLRRSYYAWLQAGRDWRALVDSRRVSGPMRRTHLAKEMHEAFKRECERNQRSSRAAYRDLMRRFRSGEFVEGVGTWTSWWANEHRGPLPATCPDGWTPRGCSYRNLMKSAGLSEFEKAASRLGRGKAKAFVPPVFSTRVGLRVGSIYQADDVWHDHDVVMPGNPQPFRALEFGMLDVFSAHRFAWACKPRLTREDGTRQNLNEVDFLELIAFALICKGYHPEGTMLIAEHRTAAVPKELEQRLLSWSDGKFEVVRGTILRGQVTAGMYPGRSGDSYKIKAHLESHHALMHNELAALPGHVGQDPDHKHEQEQGRESYHRSLVKLSENLPESARRKLILPYMQFEEFLHAVAAMHQIIATRTWHDLEGWEEAGLTTLEYRLTDRQTEWEPMDHLADVPAGERAAISALLRARPELVRARPMSPAEVWARGSGELVKLNHHLTPLILGEKAGRTVRLADNHLFEFEDRMRFGARKMRFLGSVKGPDGYPRALTAGTPYFVHVNSLDPDTAYVSDQDSGEYLGTCPAWKSVSRLDSEAVHRMQGAQAHVIAELSAPIRERHEADATALAALKEHNRRIIDLEDVADEDPVRALDAEPEDQDAVLAAPYFAEASDRKPERAEDGGQAGDSFDDIL